MEPRHMGLWIEVVKAKLRIGNVEKEAALSHYDTVAVFDVELPPGPTERRCCTARSKSLTSLMPVAESPGAVRIGHPESGHLVDYLAPNSVFNSLPRQRSSGVVAPLWLRAKSAYGGGRGMFEHEVSQALPVQAREAEEVPRSQLGGIQRRAAPPGRFDSLV